MRVDSHVHFWRYSPADYPWIAPAGTLARDRYPEELKPELGAAGLDGCLAVQARNSGAETDWLLKLAEDHGFILGVIGWVDLTGTHVADDLERLSPTKLVGIRHLAQDEVDPGYLLRPDIVSAVAVVQSRGLAFDVLVRGPAQLSKVPLFAAAADSGHLVLDHAGKPDIAGGDSQAWREAILQISSFGHVFCKLSGLVTEASHASWRREEITPYLDYLLAKFGPDRLMFGSDWPVCELASDYARVVDLVDSWVMSSCFEHRDAIFGGNARRVYLGKR